MYEFKASDVYDFANSVGADTISKGNELFFKYCPKCKGGDHHDKETFSINLTNGTFKCFRASCGYQGHFVELARDFNFPLEDLAQKKYKKLPQRKIETKPAAIRFMESRGISEEISRKYNITSQKNNPNAIVFPFYDENNILQFIKYRNAKYNGQGNKEWCEKDTKPILFGMNHCTDFETLIISEGMMDSLSVSECGINNAVSVPTGALGFTWIQFCWDWVNKFKRIIVFGDYENGKITLLEKIRNTFKMPVYSVRPQDYLGEKDANDILRKYGKKAIVTAIENAEIQEVKFTKRLSDVQSVDLSNMTKIKTGIYEFDRAIGGIYLGQVMLLSGKRGEGKLLADDTPVFTNNGWKKHGDLVVGDKVIGKNGDFVKVKHIFPKHYANMKITFSNGEEIYCHENHEWVLSLHSGNSYKEITLTTKEIYEKKEKGYTGTLRIIDTEPLKIKENDVILHKSNNVTIRNIEYCEHRQGNCIEVEGGIYCVGKTMIPTHNSTLMSQLVAEAIDQNFATFVYSGELPNYHFKNWLDLQIAGGRNVSETQNEYGDKQYFLKKEVTDKINEWYYDKAYIFDNSAVEDDEFKGILSVIEDSVCRYDIKLVCIDNLMTALDDDANSDIFRQQSMFVKKLARMAKKYNIAIILIAHPKKSNSEFNNDTVSGSSDITNAVDIVANYERNKNTEENYDSKLSVTKNRLTGKLLVSENAIALNYSAKSKRIRSANHYEEDKEYGCFKRTLKQRIEDGMEDLPF